jgi:hypothetical protein
MLGVTAVERPEQKLENHFPEKTNATSMSGQYTKRGTKLMNVHHGIIWSNTAGFFGLEVGTGILCFGGDSGIRTASSFEYKWIPAKKGRPTSSVPVSKATLWSV